MLDYAFELPPSERNSYLATEMADIRYQRCMLALESAMEDRNLRLRGAELECVKNNGTALDLMDYYEDASSNGSGKGILAKIWDAVLNLFAKIKTFLFGEKDEEPKIDPNTEVQVNKADWDTAEKTITTWDKVKGVINSDKPNKKGSAWKLVLGVGAAIGAVGATVFVTKRAKDVINLSSRSKKCLYEMETAAEQNRKNIDRSDSSSVADEYIADNKDKSNCLTILGKSIRDTTKKLKASFKPGAGKKIKSLKAADRMEAHGTMVSATGKLDAKNAVEGETPDGKKLLDGTSKDISGVIKILSGLRIRDSISVNDEEYQTAKKKLADAKERAKPLLQEYNACKKDAENGDASAAKWVKTFEEKIINPMNKAEEELSKFTHKYD
jgi:hypothetical protein